MIAHRSILIISGIVWVACFATGELRAQVATQRISLKPGWNSVSLQVDPLSPEIGRLLADTPIREIRHHEAEEGRPFPVDVDLAKAAGPNWLRFATTATAGTNTLLAVKGGRHYFIEIDPAGKGFDWDVSGRPMRVQAAWNPNATNLVGISIDPAHRPTLDTLYGASQSLRAGPFYRLMSQGRWRVVASPETETPDDGEAVAVFCRSWTEYSSPVRIVTERRDSLEFHQGRADESIRLVNLTPRPHEVRLRMSAAANVKDPAETTLGPVLLSYWDDAPPGVWKPVGDAGLSLLIPPNGIRDVRLTVRRDEMRRRKDVAAPKNAGAFLGLIEVGSAEGSIRTTLGVRVPTRPELDGATARPGIWMGWATLNAVSFPSDPDGSERMKAKSTARPFELKLIVHVDTKGQARLLSRAAEVRGANGRTVVVPGDPPGAIRRFSSVGFAAPGPFLLTERGGKRFGDTDSIYTTRVELPYNDPRNPFVHRYHPNHDNFDDRYVDKLPAGRESFDVRRDLTLTFSSADIAKTPLAGWGDDRIGGTYVETIQGVHKDPIRVEGNFVLRFVSPVAEFAPVAPSPAR